MGYKTHSWHPGQCNLAIRISLTAQVREMCHRVNLKTDGSVLTDNIVVTKALRPVLSCTHATVKINIPRMPLYMLHILHCQHASAIDSDVNQMSIFTAKSGGHKG